MRRRKFIILFSASAALPFAARAERAGKPPVIAVISAGPATNNPLVGEHLVRRL